MKKKSSSITLVTIILILMIIPIATATTEQVTLDLKDNSGATIGNAQATIAIDTTDPTQYTVRITNQKYNIQGKLVNFVGYSTTTAKYITTTTPSRFQDRATSATNTDQNPTGTFSDASILLIVDPSVKEIVIEYGVSGNGNTPSIEGEDPITLSVTGTNKIHFKLDQTQPRQDNPTRPIDTNPNPQPEESRLCSCSPCGAEECAIKDVRECPSAVKAEENGGTVSVYGDKRKILGGSWDGGVARSDAGKFAGTCKGCSNLFPAVLNDVKAKDAAACRAACDGACTDYMAENKPKAKATAEKAAQECFNTITDACSTIPLTPKKENSDKKQGEDKNQEEKNGDKKENDKPAEQPPKEKGIGDTITGFFSDVWDWLRELFGGGEKPVQPAENPPPKLCPCLCQKECKETYTYGCSYAEKTEKETGGKIGEWGTVSGVVTNGNWKGLIKKQPDNTFRGECTICSDALNIVDIPADANGNCENVCEVACKGNSKAALLNAGDVCRARLEEACR